MKKVIKILFVLSIFINLLFVFLLIFNNSQRETIENTEIINDLTTKDQFQNVQYVEASTLKILGKYHDEKRYSRLPLAYENSVRPIIWKLSQSTAGMAIRFSTNAPAIYAKWTLTQGSTPPNMTGIAAGGLDLYSWVEGKWQYVNSGIPQGKSNEVQLISNMDTIYKEFLLNMPLYDGIENISVGIDRRFEITSPQQLLFNDKKPVVFYGTSITQGASASRPGMAYPAILARRLGIEVINLGFSGNGLFEASLGKALCEINACLYILDCTPNASPDIIKNNALSLIKQLHACRPDTPILMIESLIREFAYFKNANEEIPGGMGYIAAQNKALALTFNMAQKDGIENLYYLGADSLIGKDHEGTVDGTHLNDLGNFRIAKQIEDQIKLILEHGLISE